MAKFLKNIKSLFVTGDGVAKQSKANKSQSSSQNTGDGRSSIPEMPEVNLSASDVAGRNNDKFLDILLGAMNENNREGFDYLEYKQSLVSLREMQMDESMRFKSAFAMAKTMGTTPKYLLETASHYLNILKKEEDKFQDAMDKQRQVKLESTAQGISSTEKGIKEKTQQIEQMKAEILQLKEGLEKKKKEYEKIEQKIVGARTKFDASYSHLTKQINADIQKIKSYLK